jgi:hypothetical protein
VRRIAAVAIAVGAIAVALTLTASKGATDRVTHAADAMEHLPGVRFSLEASSVATGGQALGGDLALAYRATGELVPPDRLRLRVTEPRPAELVIVGDQVWMDGTRASARSVRTLASPLAVVAQLREPGAVTFAGLGFARGSVTARYRIDRGDRGVIEVELGLLDDLVRRQTFSVSESAAGDGSGLGAVRTTFAVEYWDHGVTLDVREPNRP